MRISVQFLLVIGIVTTISFLPTKAFAQPANNLCTNATPITSSPTCVGIPGTLNGATYTAITSACGTSRPDVWYIFTAKSTNPTITITSLSNARFQVYTAASCGGTVTSVACVSSGSGTVSGLTIGNQYLIRVYQNTTGGTLTFNICVDDPAPANDLCGGAVTLTSGTSCATTSGNMYAATLTGTAVTAPNCASSVTYDVWYRFVAQTTNPTITLSNIGSSFTNPSMQLLSSNCGGTFTQFYCGTTSISANHLVPGTTYFIRVYSTGTAPTDPTNAGFDICVTDPISPPPSNDECANAVNLSVGNVCNNLPGDMAGATPSTIPLGGSCAGPNAYDVWYKFTAVNSVATITLSSPGVNFLNPRIEVLSGNCGSLTSLFCSGSPLNASGLTAGNTYYIRVYSTTAPPPNGNARFNICITSSALPAVRFGNSYVNVSKKTTGGVVEPGDTLEIRMTIHHTSGTMTNLRFVDNLPTNTTMLTGPSERIRIITNEGLPYKEYTLGGGDDAATYVAAPAPGQYNIRMNLGFGGTNPGIPVNNTATEAASATGSMAGGDRPRGGSGLLFAVAYRVRVTGAVGSTIQLNPAQFIYRTGGSDVTLTASSYQILVSTPLSLCTNSIGLNNASEFGGTFGSGTTLNRSFDLTNPIPGYSFMNNVSAFNGLGDGRYALVKNISPTSGINRNANRRPNCTPLAFYDPDNCNNRMHGGFWDIDGDHTGTNNSIGNLPPAANTNSGYMLMVNADYVASEVYSQTLNNLCPNTYYEFSAWFRNICETCGMDSTGAQFAGTATAPSAGYPGVLPNLTFTLNGLDYYNTGEISTGGWLKKGFVFRTGPSQTSATFSIRNNSQGGGGNDWVMDDIAVATCLPTMSYSPTINPFVCENNPITIADTISSFFKNYTTYKWQRSTNGGASWTDITGVTSLPDTNYYITSYTVPAANTTPANNNDLYRVVVATSAANLSDANCNISDGVTITLTVSTTCGPPLGVNIISFNGQIVNSKAQLSWTTSRENESAMFIIEKSIDGQRFFTAGEVSGNKNGNTVNRYTFTDAAQLNDATWYRILMITSSGTKRYTSIIQLKNISTNFDLGSIVNPFTNNLNLAISTNKTSEVSIELSDMSGRKVISIKKMVYTGSNGITLDTQTLPAGVYSLRILYKDQSVIRRVIKQS